MIETIADRAGPQADRLRVVLSDNIGVRCGCVKPWIDASTVVMLIPGRRKQHRIAIAVRCQSCGAGWEWGEVCAVLPDAGPYSPVRP